MEDKETSPTDHCTSPERKSFLLGVVNASEIKCKIDRKRRWDQAPDDNLNEDSSPTKLQCDNPSVTMENDVSPSDDNDSENNDNRINFPSLDNQLNDRLTHVSDKKECLVTPQVLNDVHNQTSFPLIVSNSFSKLNSSDDNLRVENKIESEEVTLNYKEISKSSIKVHEPKSPPLDISSFSEVSIPKNVVNAVDISPTLLDKNLILEPEEVSSDLLSKIFVKKYIEPDASISKTSSSIKGLVDYDDYSDESSQQSDKISQLEPVVDSVNQLGSEPSGNSIDSKEEEFHDCIDKQNEEESVYNASTSNKLSIESSISEDLLNEKPNQFNEHLSDKFSDTVNEPKVVGSMIDLGTNNVKETNLVDSCNVFEQSLSVPETSGQQSNVSGNDTRPCTENLLALSKTLSDSINPLKSVTPLKSETLVDIDDKSLLSTNQLDCLENKNISTNTISDLHVCKSESLITQHEGKNLIQSTEQSTVISSSIPEQNESLKFVEVEGDYSNIQMKLSEQALSNLNYETGTIGIKSPSRETSCDNVGELENPKSEELTCMSENKGISSENEDLHLEVISNEKFFSGSVVNVNDVAKEQLKVHSQDKNQPEIVTTDSHPNVINTLSWIKNISSEVTCKNNNSKAIESTTLKKSSEVIETLDTNISTADIEEKNVGATIPPQVDDLVDQVEFNMLKDKNVTDFKGKDLIASDSSKGKTSDQTLLTSPVKNVKDPVENKYNTEYAKDKQGEDVTDSLNDVDSGSKLAEKEKVPSGKDIIYKKGTDVTSEEISRKNVESALEASDNNKVGASSYTDLESLNQQHCSESVVSQRESLLVAPSLKKSDKSDLSSTESSLVSGSCHNDQTLLSLNLSNISNKESNKTNYNLFSNKLKNDLSVKEDELKIKKAEETKQVSESGILKNESSNSIVDGKVPDTKSSSSDILTISDSGLIDNSLEMVSVSNIIAIKESTVKSDEVSLSLNLKNNSALFKDESDLISKKSVGLKKRSLEFISDPSNLPESSQSVTNEPSRDSMDIIDCSAQMSEKYLIEDTNVSIKDDCNDNFSVEPLTLRINKKDSIALPLESAESLKKPRLDDSSKQLEFTLKISKDVSTNIPKATMSPKRTQSPLSLPEPTLSRLSSDVSITPFTGTPSLSDSPNRPSKNSNSACSSSLENTDKISITKSELSKNSSEIPPLNNIPGVIKKELNYCNSVKNLVDSSIIDVKNEVLSKGLYVNSSTKEDQQLKKVLTLTPVVPKRRGRPPKRRVEDTPETNKNNLAFFETTGELISREADSTTDTPLGRPVRECRDRTRPILGRPRKPRGRGGGRGGARVPLIPGREALSAREQEELDRIEARNQQIRLEKLAKREAKLAKKAKKESELSDTEKLPSLDMTEEELAEYRAKREIERKAAAEEAARLAEEAAAAKEAEKLAKILARKERLKELHRMKRDKMLAKKAAKKLKDEERRKRKAAEKAAEQAAALQNMYEDETRMSAPDGSLRPLYGEDNRNRPGRMEISLHESNNYSVEQLAEYQWEDGELFMIQEQVAEYLGVKSFKRKYPDLKRRPVDAEERKYLEEAGLVPKSVCDLGITAVSSAEVLDIMYQDFPHKYEEVRKYLREKQMREISSKQRALSLYSKQSDKAKADLREQALDSAASWNAHLNRERKEERRCSMDLQSFIVHYPHSKRERMKQTFEATGNYPVAVLPGQYCDYYKRYTSNELMYYPINTVLYGPLKPNERHIFQDDAWFSECEESSSSDETSSSSSSDSESEGDEDTKCKICNFSSCNQPDESEGILNCEESLSDKPEIFLPCSKCSLLCHPSCCKITEVMLPHVRKYNWMCPTCKICPKCDSSENQTDMKLCDLCDRGYHLTCLDPRKMVPEGNRWHCAVCSFCWSCGSKEPGGPSNQWLHEFIKDEKGEKVYQRSLCTSCCANIGKEAAVAAVAAAAASAGTSGMNFNTNTIVNVSCANGEGSSAAYNTTTSNASNTPGVSPLKNFHLIQTKNGNQVRLSISGGIMNRSPMLARTSDTVVLRNPVGPTIQRLPSTPNNIKTTESQLNIRTPLGVPTISRPRNIFTTPNDRGDSSPPHSNVIEDTACEKK